MQSLNKHLKICITITALAIGLTSVLSSCNSSDNASKENFTKIISEYIKDKRICSAITYNLPITIFDKEITDGSRKVYASRLDFFSSIGFIKATKGNVSEPSPIIWVVNPPKPATTYTITEEGDKNSVHTIQPGSNTTSYGFCYAKGKELIDIQSFESTVNTQQNIENVSVIIRSKPIGLADWTGKAPDKEIYSKQDYFDTIIVTNFRRGKGWYVNDSGKRK